MKTAAWGFVKRQVRRGLSRRGYVLRGVGQGGAVTGVDVWHDAGVLLGDKAGAVLFDVGANTGQTVAELLDAFAEPKVYCFEPSPRPHAELLASYGDRAGVQVEKIALGDRQGSLTFHVTRGYSVNDSLLKPAWDAQSEQVEVEADTLDHYCETHGVAHIDVLKIDTQGNDLNVLRGAAGMLRAGRVGLFVVEVMLTRMYEGQPGLVDLYGFAEQAGYHLVGFYDQTYIKNRISYLNALFQRP